MTISVRLPEEYENQLARLAAQTKRSKGFFIREALIRHLEDIADEYIALDRVANPGRLLTTKELLKELGADK